MSSYYDSIRKEVLNNKQDAMIADAELENEKNILVERVKNGVGEDLRNNVQYFSRPTPYKKPFRLRFKAFFDKIKYILFGGEYDGA